MMSSRSGECGSRLSQHAGRPCRDSIADGVRPLDDRVAGNAALGDRNVLSATTGDDVPFNSVGASAGLKHTASELNRPQGEDSVDLRSPEWAHLVADGAMAQHDPCVDHDEWRMRVAAVRVDGGAAPAVGFARPPGELNAEGRFIAPFRATDAPPHRKNFGERASRVVEVDVTRETLANEAPAVQ